MTSRVDWLQAQQQQHRDRADRRKQRESPTFDVGIDHMLTLLHAGGVDITVEQLVPFIAAGLPYIQTADGPKLDEAQFVADAQQLQASWRELEAVERQERDEDNAFEILQACGTLDEQIANGLVHEDDKHGLTITVAGWGMAKSLGWQALA